MSRHFASTSDTCSIDAISGVDFSAGSVWTIAMFARFENLSAAQNCALISKYKPSISANQALFRVTKGGGFFQVYRTSRKWNEQFVDIDKWYMFACSCDGSSELTLDVVLVDGGVFEIDGETATADSDDPLTAPIQVGAWGDDGAKDPMIGDVSSVGYFSSAFSREEVVGYLRAPNLYASRADCEFFLPMLGGPTIEPDWSSHEGRDFSVSGGSTGRNPPISTLGLGVDIGWQGITLESVVAVELTCGASASPRAEVASEVSRTSSATSGAVARGSCGVEVAAAMAPQGSATARGEARAEVGRPVVAGSSSAVRSSVVLSVDTTIELECAASGIARASAALSPADTLIVKARGVGRGSCTVEIARALSVGAGVLSSGKANTMVEFDFVGMHEKWTVPSGGSGWSVPSTGRGWTIPDQ